MKSGLRVVTLLAGVASFGCATLPDVPPSLPDGRLVPGSVGCSNVARGDDAVWWVNDRGDLMKTDPRSLEVLAQFRIPASHSFTDIATGFETVWLAEANGSYIHKFDLNVNQPTAKIKIVSPFSGKGERTYLAVGDRSVWATYTALDKVFRINPENDTVVATITTGFVRRGPLAAGPLAVGEGAVWVLGRGGVARVDSETNGVTANIPVHNLIGTFEAIAVGGGSVWVAGIYAVTRISPKENRVVATIPLRREGRKPPFVQGMAVARERLWALVLDDAGTFTDMLYAHVSLAEIDLMTNSVRSMRQLGSMHTGSGIAERSLAVLDDAAWVCLPSGLYVIPITPPN